MAPIVNSLARALLLGAIGLSLGSCRANVPVEVDGDEIRARIAEAAEGQAESRAWLLELAARSEDARGLIFREVDRLLRDVRLQEDQARAEEIQMLAAGRPLTSEEQSRLSEVVTSRARLERRRRNLEAIVEAIS